MVSAGVSNANRRWPLRPEERKHCCAAHMDKKVRHFSGPFLFRSQRCTHVVGQAGCHSRSTVARRVQNENNFRSQMYIDGS